MIERRVSRERLELSVPMQQAVAKVDLHFETGWWNRVNTEILHQSSLRNCVLGQLSNDCWSSTIRRIGGFGIGKGADYPFASNSCNAAWIAVINARRANRE